jgi:hypothetical protein
MSKSPSRRSTRLLETDFAQWARWLHLPEPQMKLQSFGLASAGKLSFAGTRIAFVMMKRKNVWRR